MFRKLQYCLWVVRPTMTEANKHDGSSKNDSRQHWGYKLKQVGVNIKIYIIKDAILILSYF